jgi:hypothetical protein
MGAGLVAGCGGAAKPTPISPEMRERGEKAIAALEPDVKEHLSRKGWRLEGIDEDRLQLIEFFVMRQLGRTSFYAQMKAENLASAARIRFTAEHQIAAVEQKLYDFVSLPNRRIIIVFSSNDLKMQRKEIEPTLRLVNTWLPRIDDYLGGIYPDPFLHVQVGMNGDASSGLGLTDGLNTTFGPNIWLTTDSQASPEVFCHEAVHIYNTRFSQPHWALEAIPDIIDDIFTGQALYRDYDADGGKFELDIAGAPRDVLDTQVGNAALMLTALRKAMGGTSFQEAMRQVISEDKLRFPYNAKITGREILRTFKQHAPDKAVVDSIYVRWVTGYVPGSV